MTAADELRRLLDERGVEHTDADDGHTQHTWWSDGDHEIAASNSGKRLAVYNLTPEQAIAATLGAGTCRIKPWEMEQDTGFYDCMECECGYVSDVSDWAKWHFCPTCGRRVVDG